MKQMKRVLIFFWQWPENNKVTSNDQVCLLNQSYHYPSDSSKTSFIFLNNTHWITQLDFPHWNLKKRFVNLCFILLIFIKHTFSLQMLKRLSYKHENILPSKHVRYINLFFCAEIASIPKVKTCYIKFFFYKLQMDYTWSTFI